MHLLIQTADQEQVYIVYDFVLGNLVQVNPFITRDMMMSLYPLMTNKNEAILVSEGSSEGLTIFKATFDEASDEINTKCSWDEILESLHIAFMQQEALRFEKETTDEQRDSESLNLYEKHGLFEEQSEKEEDNEESYDDNSDYSQKES